MLRLQFSKDHKSLFSFKTQASFFRIGRSSECEIVLNDESISRIHCIFRKREDAWTVEDVSSNGIQIGREFAASHFRLEKEKIYQLSRYYQFSWVDEVPQGDDKTIILSRRPTQIFLEESKDETLALGEARISGFNEKNEKIVRRIGSDGLSIGRHLSNDLRINSERVSQFHARIELRNNQHHIIDLGSTNGTCVEGQKILRAVLPVFASIQIGDTTWEFSIERQEVQLRIPGSDHFFGLVSKCKNMKKVFAMTEAVAQTDAPVLIQGETGTGKELLAKALHDLSPRSGGTFLALNCAALPKELLESEIFGHSKGAFTGALQNRQGAFEAANGGTLFLDEVAELDLGLQAKLLRVLETGEVKRLGSNEIIQTSVRIVSATHKDLRKLVRDGSFREDLYFRLHVVPLSLPPLRNRKGDLRVLVPQLLEQLKEEASVEDGVYDILEQQAFPGNVRQLKNILQRALVEYRMKSPSNRSQKKQLKSSHFEFLNSTTPLSEIQNPSDIHERDKLLGVLRQHDFNQSRTARELKVPISTLHDRIRRLSIEIPPKRHRG